jgi:hypothetical protein
LIDGASNDGKESSQCIDVGVCRTIIKSENSDHGNFEFIWTLFLGSWDLVFGFFKHVSKYRIAP